MVANSWLSVKVVVYREASGLETLFDDDVLLVWNIMTFGTSEREEMIWKKLRVEKHLQVKTRLVVFEHKQQFKQRSKYTSLQNHIYVDHDGCARPISLTDILCLDSNIVYVIIGK
jgi:hypothetical protein